MNEEQGPFLPMLNYASYIDASGGEVEYFNNKYGAIESYRRKTASKSVIMPVGDFRKFFQFNRERTPFPVEIWFPMDMRTQTRISKEIKPEIEKEGRIGWVAYHQNEVNSISLGNFFCYSGREWIMQLKEPILEIFHGTNQIGLINLFLQDSDVQRVVEQENPKPGEMSFYPIISREGEVVSRLSWEQKNDFFIVKQTYYPDSEREITKTLRAPIKINGQEAEEKAFQSANLENPVWPHIDSFIPVHIGFSGPGFAKFMGVANE